MLLELNELRKTFQSDSGVVRAVDGVSLSVDAGQFVAVQGPSGCGKSTLLLMAGGLLAPDSGAVVVADANPYELAPNGRARFRAETVGFVFQQFHLVPYLSVFDNVLAPSIAAERNGARDRAALLIRHFGLEHRRHHVPGQLSTGERQRTALARALLNEPKVILADEPTGNLDAENARIVLTHLKEFADHGGAVLLVTHDQRAAEFTDAVLKLRNGRVEV